MPGVGPIDEHASTSLSDAFMNVLAPTDGT